MFQPLVRKKVDTLIDANKAGVKVQINQQGKMQVYVASSVLPGRGSIMTLENAARQNDEQRRKSVAKVAALLAIRQNQLWGDKHDPAEVIRKADDCLSRVLKDGRPVAAVGLFTTFAPLGQDAPGKKTKDIASRASEDDPFTKDFLRGKDWELQ